MLVVCALMPTVNEVSDHFPADLLWRFPHKLLRHASCALERHRCVFGALAERPPATRGQRLAFRRG